MFVMPAHASCGTLGGERLEPKTWWRATAQRLNLALVREHEVTMLVHAFLAPLGIAIGDLHSSKTCFLEVLPLRLLLAEEGRLWYSCGHQRSAIQSA